MLCRSQLPKYSLHCYVYLSKSREYTPSLKSINPLNAELNPICHLLVLLEGATIVDVSRLMVKVKWITFINCHAETCRRKLTVISCTVSVFSCYIK